MIACCLLHELASKNVVNVSGGLALAGSKLPVATGAPLKHNVSVWRGALARGV